MQSAKTFLILTLTLVGSYWSASQFHHGYCAPSGFWGLISTGVTMGSPICLAATEIISQASRIYAASWVAALGSVVSYIYEKTKDIGVKDMINDSSKKSD